MQLIRVCACLALTVTGFGVASTSAETYDVIVAGSEPEAISAAISAAQSGAKTLLVSQDARVGGLFVLGGLNMLDVRTDPLLQQGLFLNWWQRVGKTSAFDTRRAEAAFEAMLQASKVTTRLGVKQLRYLGQKQGGITLAFADHRVMGKQLIDATADGDIAAQAGVPYTTGWQSMGVNARMADTLVLRFHGANWARLSAYIKAQGKGFAAINSRAAWGHFGKLPAAYKSTSARLRLRGLNMGLEDDGSVLVNALLIYGVQPQSPASRKEAVRLAQREGPAIARYLRRIPGLEQLRYAGSASKLYIRDWRHFHTECTLSVDDTLGNVVRQDDVAAGNYPLDTQTLTPSDDGYVFGMPKIYGVRLCAALAANRDNLWVVGKSAGFDPLAASSARVVPFGMAFAEAVGMAAATASKKNLSARAFIHSAPEVRALQRRLTSQGAYLPTVQLRPPTGPYQHVYFPAYTLLRRKGLTVAGYRNDPQLGAPMSTYGFVYLLSNVSTRFFSQPTVGSELAQRFLQEEDSPLQLTQALTILRTTSCLLQRCYNFSHAHKVVLAAHKTSARPLNRGEAYALAAAFARLASQRQ